MLPAVTIILGIGTINSFSRLIIVANSLTFPNELQTGAALVLTANFGVGWLALRHGHLLTATRLMVGGVCVGGLFVVLQRGITNGIDLLNLVEFFFFGAVIVLVGLFGDFRAIIGMTLITNLATYTLLNLSPRLHPDTDVLLAVHAIRFQIGGIAIAAEWLIAIFMIAQWATYRQTLRDLSAAYDRERQLDDLKDQFITNINHELRTPMTTLHGYIELLRLKRQHLSEHEIAYALEKASQSGTAFIQLMSGILDAQRAEQDALSLEHTSVPLQPAVAKALDLVGLAETSGRPIHVTLPADMAVWGDPTAVQQILLNLLSNARKYSPPHAPIVVSAHYATQRVTRNEHTAGMVEIRVRDRGKGIPPDKISLLFRRFVRLPRDLASTVPGNGVGLFLCRVLAEAMGGEIGVESTGVDGEGSTFWVHLPAASDHVETGSESAAEAAQVRSQWTVTRPRKDGSYKHLAD